MNEIEQIIKAVETINGDIFDMSKGLFETNTVLFKYTGFWYNVEFLGIEIWGSENDTRIMNMDEEPSESFYECFTRMVDDICQHQLRNIKFYE